ncbi:MAG: putative zinc-binding peptidase [Steroidobacteraceae bacterium]
MKVFHCDNCRNLVFFENVHCGKCQRPVAFLPDTGVMASLTPVDDTIWLSEHPSAQSKRYRLCHNYSNFNICNWAVPEEDDNPLCASCRLTRVIPDLGQPGNMESWYKMEAAKRRLIYSLFNLQLPLHAKTGEAPGLAYEFKANVPETDAEAVLTGHDAGLITINIAEADDAEREKRRLNMHEPYRTLLGHFRHEIGHYYWDVLVRDSARLEAYRDMFGDETSDYAHALKRHYEQGPPPNWQNSFVSAYATSHPWEDWAETWAHYLHMTDGLETAAACGLTLRPLNADEPELQGTGSGIRQRRFNSMISDWFALAYALNNLNRSMGLMDAYPFVLSEPVIAKLRFVHETIHAAMRL